MLGDYNMLDAAMQKLKSQQNTDPSVTSLWGAIKASRDL